MNLHRWQFEFFCDVGVFDCLRFIQRFTFDPFGHQRAGSDGRATAIGLKACVFNNTFIVNFDLQLHHVSAGWCTHHAGTDVVIAIIKRTNVAWVFVVIDYFFAVSHF